jgi:hypothetical protein
MNVEFVWSPAPKWSCLTVVMQCASNATAIGNYKPRNLTAISCPFPLWILDIEESCHYFHLFGFFHNCRNTRSESCPFCRGSLKRVNSEDLWVLTCNSEVVDTKAISKEDLLRFYLYINSLPKDYPDALFLVYYEYLIWIESKLEEWCIEGKCRPSKCK